jgi:hypothetical protein
MSQTMATCPESVAGGRIVGGRTMSQGVFGGIAVILGIVGLAIFSGHPDVPMYLAAVAAIALGLSLISVGTSLAASYSRLAARAEASDPAAGGQVGGTPVDMFLGAVIILGVLALLRLDPAVLIPVQVILVGAGMILNGAGTIRLAALETDMAAERTIARRINEELVFSTATVRMIAGIAVLIMGILGVVGTEPMLLALSAMLAAGGALLLNSTSLSHRMVGILIPRS